MDDVAREERRAGREEEADGELDGIDVGLEAVLDDEVAEHRLIESRIPEISSIAEG